MVPLKKALNHGGTQRKGRDRSQAKRKHVQIGTVDPLSGRPAVRTVVFRGFLPRKYVDPTSRGEESCCPMFITDDRSAKFRHLGGEGGVPRPVEVCWWLDEAGVQVLPARPPPPTARPLLLTLCAIVSPPRTVSTERTRRPRHRAHQGRCAALGGGRRVSAPRAVVAGHFFLAVSGCADGW